MRIIVTGGAGFIGSHVAEAYVAEGHEVHIVDNLATGRRANAPRGATLHEVDIHSQEADRLFAILRPEIVNHHAAQSSPPAAEEDVVHDLELNGGGTARVADLAARYGARKVIYASSGEALYRGPLAGPIAEDHPIEPSSPYGLSKWVGELYLQLYARMRGLGFTILRYANPYGPRQDPYEPGSVAAILGAVAAGREAVAPAWRLRDLVFASDIARANVSALTGGEGLAINIGGGLARPLCEALGAPSPPAAGHGREPAAWLDCQLARRVLGWVPVTGLEEGLREVREWLAVGHSRAA